MNIIHVELMTGNLLSPPPPQKKVLLFINCNMHQVNDINIVYHYIHNTNLIYMEALKKITLIQDTFIICSSLPLYHKN